MDKDKLIEIIKDFFDIGNDTYAYILMRTKNAKSYGTLTIDDFEEFDCDTAEDLADYIIKNYK